MRRRPLLAAAGSAAATSLAGCLDLFGTTVSESFENTYDVTDETTLAVSNRNGPVTVRDTDTDQLTVSGEKRAGSETGLDEISVDVTVRVGPDLSVGFSLSTSNGEASVVDLPHTASTSRRGLVEGQLRGGTEPVLTAETTNGDVTLRPLDED